MLLCHLGKGVAKQILNRFAEISAFYPFEKDVEETSVITDKAPNNILIDPERRVGFRVLEPFSRNGPLSSCHAEVFKLRAYTYRSYDLSVIG